ncbi:hypothetical protein E4U22_006456 [Claviceps purpurea]|uniref:Related to Ras-GTPase-activating protein binding protein 2 n=1 Tax=Claviceps purpurea (strain 20.1) TaxID=1111077 RepID=M1VYU0_CLAP2|nr:hypothetical protein E4U28_003231 [Claviceps purpurea]KAG6151465.1 hypothetical protein E4U37_004938 [Claviceps purpurea]KAG6296541.1 hypothetical protein E4U46_002091 [Claviceps purpurea]KAG6317172.1 hypothetical protein E4U22_006456 [Claviceps purpurea]CCE34377.1 related to Ras-GTPase-activating protein binding protein 2 [Claviceps purpurea 20.1]
MASNGNFVQQEQYKNVGQAAYADADPNTADRSLSKEQVGWFFVEQYYTTLSQQPEKLHLFYNKISQFVYGLEAEVTNVAVGRQQIQERIKALEFLDCKVRVSNVDTQGSFDNIVIQVIGETSSKGDESKKFVQTFVLAQQPSGYFVLNDILRYISEDEEDNSTAPADTPVESQEPAPTVAEPECAEGNGTEEPKLDAEAVDEKLNEAAVSQNEPLNGNLVAEHPKIAEADPEPAAEVPSQVTAEETAASPEKSEKASPSPAAQPKQEEAVAVAAPPASAPIPSSSDSSAPIPSSAPTPATTSTPAPAPAPAPAAPPKPMTWAGRAAAAATGPRPVVPLPKAANTPAPAVATGAGAPVAPSTAPPAASAAANPVLSPASAKAVPVARPAAPAAHIPETATKESTGWKTAGVDSKRQTRSQSISTHAAGKEGTLAYVKFVNEKVRDADLRNALSACGELAYFDINRQKNCAFVEFKTVEGYQAAVAANPHPVNGAEVVVEPRRPKTTGHGATNYHTHRGNGSGGRGRGGSDGSRIGQGSQRGNYSGQSRGRGGAVRGRGGAQATNA